MKILHMLTARTDDFNNQYLQNNPEKDPVIMHSCDDRREFVEVMHLDTPKRIQGDSNIVKAYNFFYDYLLSSKKNGVNLTDLLNVVNASINFVAITLKQDDDEQQIFDTINSLGVPLTTDELLKNFLYEASDEEAYVNEWKKLFDDDKARLFWGTDAAARNESKGKENRVIERFFHAFVRLKMWDFKLNESQRKNYVKMENVFTTCKDFVEKFGMEKQELAKEIIEYAKLFKEHLNASILTKRIPHYSCISRVACFIYATKGFAVFPYVLYILKNQKDEAERNKVFEYLESYLVRRMISLSSSCNKDYTNLFAEYMISQRIDNHDKLKSYIEAKRSTDNLRMPSYNEVAVGMGTKSLDEQTARIVYYLYETKLSTISEKSFTEGFTEYNAVQLMPMPKEGYNNNWPPHDDIDDEKERIRLIKTLGNYFLLDGTADLKELKKKQYEDLAIKKQVFGKYVSKIRSSEAKLKEIYKWTEGDINARNNGFSKMFCNKIWTEE